MSNNEMISFPRELSDELAELIAEKARVCGGGAFEIWEAICEQFGTQAQHQGDPVALTVGDRIEWMQKFDGDLWEDWMGDDSITTERLPSWMTENGVPEQLESSPLAVLLQAKIKHLERKLAEQPAHYTAVDMTTAAAQGFRDGQAAVVEPASVAEKLIKCLAEEFPDSDTMLTVECVADLITEYLTGLQ